MRKIKPILIFAAFVIITSLWAQTKAGRLKPVSQTSFLLNTICTITVYDTRDTSEIQEIIQNSFDLCSYYESLFSKTIKDSEILAINNAKGASVSLSPETQDLLALGIAFGDLTNGLFDITIGSISTLWHFTSDTPETPAPEKLASALEHVNYKGIRLNGDLCYLEDPDAILDLGGIAKGYIADRIGNYLLECGINCAIINLGGDIILLGTPPDKEGFTVGLQAPFADRNDIFGNITLENQSIVTSGIYERYFSYDNQIYHHILDPRTGYPAQSDIISATVLSEDNATGDAVSTSLLLMGCQKGLDFVEDQDGIEAIIVTKDLEVYLSSGLEDRIISYQITDDCYHLANR